MQRKILTFVVCFLALFFQVKAQLGFLKEGKFDYYEFFEELDLLDVKIYAEDESIEAGKAFYVLLDLKIAPQWRCTWINPGDFGTPNQLQWKLPPGFEVLSVQWPLPRLFKEEGKTLYAYEEQLFLLALLQAPQQIGPKDSLELDVDLHWFLCKDKCIPGLSELKLSLPVKEQPAQKNVQNEALFAKARENMPQKAWSAQASLEGKEICLRFSQEADVQDLVFFPLEEGLIDRDIEPKVLRQGQCFSLCFAKGKWFEEKKFQNLEGVLAAKVDGKEKAFLIDLPVSGPWLDPKKQEKEESFSLKPFLKPLFGLPMLSIFLLGLLSNFLPNVFPLLSMLIMHAIHLSKQKFWRQFSYGFSLLLGVVLSFFALFLTLPFLSKSLLYSPLAAVVFSYFYLLIFLALAQIMPSRLLAITGKYAPKQAPRFMCVFLLPSFVLFSLLPWGLGTLFYHWMQRSLEAPCLYLAGLFLPALLSFFLGIYLPLLTKPGRWMLFMRHWNAFFIFMALILFFCHLSLHYHPFACLSLQTALLLFALAMWIFNEWSSRSNFVRALFILLSMGCLFLSVCASYKFLCLSGMV